MVLRMSPDERERRAFESAFEMFRAVVDLDGAERAAFLDRECAENPALRAEIEALLRSDEAASSRLDAGVSPLAFPAAEPRSASGTIACSATWGRGGWAWSTRPSSRIPGGGSP